MCIKGSFVCQLVYWGLSSSKVDVFIKVFIFFLLIPDVVKIVSASMSIIK